MLLKRGFRGSSPIAGRSITCVTAAARQALPLRQFILHNSPHAAALSCCCFGNTSYRSSICACSSAMSAAPRIARLPQHHSQRPLRLRQPTRNLRPTYALPDHPHGSDEGHTSTSGSSSTTAGNGGAVGSIYGHIASSAIGAAAGTAAAMAALRRCAALAALSAATGPTAVAVAAGALGGAVVAEVLLGGARAEDVETDKDVEREMEAAADRVIQRLREVKAEGGFHLGGAARHRNHPDTEDSGTAGGGGGGCEGALGQADAHEEDAEGRRM